MTDPTREQIEAEHGVRVLSSGEISATPGWWLAKLPGTTFVVVGESLQDLDDNLRQRGADLERLRPPAAGERQPGA